MTSYVLCAARDNRACVRHLTEEVQASEVPGMVDESEIQIDDTERRGAAVNVSSYERLIYIQPQAKVLGLDTNEALRERLHDYNDTPLASDKSYL